MELRIATYNIHKGVSAFGRKARIHGLKDAIDLLDADLVFLQEVQGQHDLHEKKHDAWPKVGQHEFIAGEHLHHVYGKNAQYHHGHHGNALLSRFPIASSFNHDVSDHEFEQRGNLHVVVDRAGVQIHCFVIHLGLFAASRRRQIQSLIQYIQHNLPVDAPLIIAGDFNDWTKRLSPLLVNELQVFEAFNGGNMLANQTLHPPQKNKFMPIFNSRPKTSYARTFPAGLPWLCLDRVYLRGFEVTNTNILTGAPWANLSDHIPITVDLRLQQAIVQKK